MASFPTVEVTQHPIRLGQFLKLANLAESGAQARDLIEQGEVLVNGEVDERRGRQLAQGDTVVVATPQGEDGAVVG